MIEYASVSISNSSSITLVSKTVQKYLVLEVRFESSREAVSLLLGIFSHGDGKRKRESRSHMLFVACPWYMCLSYTHGMTSFMIIISEDQNCFGYDVS